MKYYLDTEFHEYQKQPKSMGINLGDPINTIELISIGIVGENSRTYYEICTEFDIDEAWNNNWLRINVLMPIFFELALFDFHNTHFKDDWILNGEEVNLEMFKANERWSENIKWFKKLVYKYGKSKYQIAKEILQFVGGNANELQFGQRLTWETNTNPEFWAYYADYDWVAFCWLYGRMIDLPEGYPKFCFDLKQKMEFYGLDNDWKQKACPDPEGAHNAREDAKWNFMLDQAIEKEISNI